ncbi:MAG TPA: DUF3667 domain-containing protein [Puia sp.]|nr:DUF3667 domain-containing protein [Puia sp.]
MSAHHYRKEKKCLNCGADVPDKFCSHCGQANTESKESFLHLVADFFSDITHYDSKVFITLRDLIFKPGFLTKEYNAGRRVTYLNPIRLYVFISAVFFLVLFASTKENEKNEKDDEQSTNIFRQKFADSLRTAANNLQQINFDTVRKNIYKEIASRIDPPKPPADLESFGFAFGSSGELIINMEEYKYHNIREYDSVQKKLPDSSRDKGFMRWLLRNNIRLKSEHENRSHVKISIDMQHSLPKIMFVLLPLFAFFVSWFYSWKKYFYAQHAIFTIHFHAFIFLLFLLILLLDKIFPWEWSGLILLGMGFVFGFLYLTFALKKVYQQSLILSGVKALAISFIYSIAVIISIWLLVLITFLFV